MDADTGRIRVIRENEKPRPREVIVNKPDPNCGRCHGDGSIPVEKANRPERRRWYKKGLPLDAKYIPCPTCNPI
jgi:hypothetical protein